MTAGRNVAIFQDVVTRDAPLSITATGGTVAVATEVPGQPGVMPQVRSGSGALSITAGADLYVGSPASPRPNTETPYITTGGLSLSSTAGSLFLEAPIPATTGRVTLNGGNGVFLNERIYTSGQDVSITAGLGGIVMNTTVLNLFDAGTASNYGVLLSDIDVRQGNITLVARGDINAPSVRSLGTISITSTEGRITSGQVLVSRSSAGVFLGMPQRVVLAGALGIDEFQTDSTPDVDARSSQGSVRVFVYGPQRFYAQAALDVITNGLIGQRVEFVAGRDVQLGRITQTGYLHVSAGRDFVFTGADNVVGLTANVGRDVLFTNLGQPTFVGSTPGTITLRNPASLGTVAAVHGLSLTAGRDVTLAQSLRVGDGVNPAQQPTTITAGRNIAFGLLETNGNVSLTATTGNITVSEPLGGPVGVAPGFWNPTDLGLNSLALSAPGAGALVNLTGVRGQGDVSLLVPAGTINSVYAVTSAAGTVTIVAPVQNISATPIPLGVRLVPPGFVAPGISPGPLRFGPDGPVIPGAPAPGAPGLPEILVSAPGAIDAGAQGAPGQAGSGTGDVNAEQAAASARGAGSGGSAGAGETESTASGPGLVIYSGGRGAAQSTDLGRSGTYGAARSPQDESDEAKRRRARRP
jgi:hypothetical protein